MAPPCPQPLLLEVGKGFFVPFPTVGVAVASSRCPSADLCLVADIGLFLRLLQACISRNTNLSLGGYRFVPGQVQVCPSGGTGVLLRGKNCARFRQVMWSVERVNFNGGDVFSQPWLASVKVSQKTGFPEVWNSAFPSEMLFFVLWKALLRACCPASGFLHKKERRTR